MNDDPLSNYFNEVFKQVSDAFNGGLEQAQRQRECKIRRFYTTGRSPRQDGVVLPNGQVVVYDGHQDSIQIFSGLKGFTGRNIGSIIQWIDPEPAQ